MMQVRILSTMVKNTLWQSKGFFGGAQGWSLPDSYSYGGSLWNTVNLMLIPLAQAPL